MCNRLVRRMGLAAMGAWMAAAGVLAVSSPAQAADDPLAILIVPDDWRGPLLRDRSRAGVDPWSYRDVDTRLIDPFPHAREDLTDPWSGLPAMQHHQCGCDCSVVLIPTGWDD